MKRIVVLVLVLLAAALLVGPVMSAQPFESHVVYLPVVTRPERVIVFGVGATYEDSHQAMENLGAAGAWTQQWRRFPEDYPGIDVPKFQTARDVCGSDWVEPGDECVCQPLGGDGPYVLNLNEPNLTGQNNYQPEEAMAVLLWEAMQCHPDRRHVGMGTTDVGYQERVFEHYRARYGAYPPMAGLAVHCYGNWDLVAAAVSKCAHRVDRAAVLAVRFGVPELFVPELAYTGYREYHEDRAIQFMEQMVEHIATVPERFLGIRKVWIGWFQARYMCVGYPEEKWWLWPDRCTSLAEWESQELTPLGVRYRELSMQEWDR